MKTERELTKTIRANILSDLRLFASRDEQKAHPVPVEYFCMWGDDHYHPSDVSFREAFTPAELNKLAYFDRCVEKALQRLGEVPPTPEELWCHPEWNMVMQKASDILKELGQGPQTENSKP